MSVPVVLVSTSQRLVAICGAEVRTVHEGAGLYFGIAQTGDRWYVAAHEQTDVAPSIEELERQRACLLVFDADLRLVDRRDPDGFALRQPHGLAAIDGEVWITATYDDHVVIHDPDARTSHDLATVEIAPGQIAAVTCSSQEGVVRSLDGWCRRVGGFPRGLAATTEGSWVGFSAVSVRRYEQDWQVR